MFSFTNDYSEGACRPILENLIKTNYVQTDGYGLDLFCKHAEKMIKDIVFNENVDIHFIPGGTPANVLAISTLKSYEAVICVETGHINTHETGAVEATGHKILQVKGVKGKILPAQIEEVVLNHTDEHVVIPKMVFISNSTELGTIYTKQELAAISEMCKKYNLYLYMDGARLGSALTSKSNDLTLKDICELVDMFYIGGTKNGALLGEAMVIKNNNLKANFRWLLKQHGSMLAKARIIGIEFITLLENNLYFELANNANTMAQQLNDLFVANNIQMYIDSPTNQIFPILDNELLAKIRTKYEVGDWCKFDDNHTVVRFVCSWATKQENIDAFKADFQGFVRPVEVKQEVTSVDNILSKFENAETQVVEEPIQESVPVFERATIEDVQIEEPIQESIPAFEKVDVQEPTQEFVPAFERVTVQEPQVQEEPTQEFVPAFERIDVLEEPERFEEVNIQSE